jgi:carboxypeptidase C (cathepsin A)
MKRIITNVLVFLVVAAFEVAAAQVHLPGAASRPVAATSQADRPLTIPVPPNTQPAATEPTARGATRPESVHDQPSVTHHTLEVAGRTLAYTATTGLMSIRNEQGNVQAEIFYVAYTRDGVRSAERPVTFAFNGGPGASSIWLHMAALGPRRAVLAENGTGLPVRYCLVDNQYTWLDFTDLVFIDPPGTGFSRAAAGVDAKQFYSLKSDVQVIGEFIRQYVTNQDRWLSPKYLAGESYGTTRAAALAGHLPRKIGMTVDGLVLISAALDFQAIMFDEGNDLPYVLFLPAYAATAWYHHKLPAALQDRPLAEVLAEVETWASTDYRLALAQGDALSQERREQVVDRYVRYSGLSKEFVERSNLRVANMQYTHEILHDRNRVVGILDGRVTGLSAGREDFTSDPSLFVTLGPLVATLYDYTRTELDFRSDRSYEFLSSDVGNQWNWGSASEGFPSVLPSLRQAMSADPRMRVLMAAGYYDLDTSYASQKYSIDHLLLDSSLRGNVRWTYYSAGHQLYTVEAALKALCANAAEFYGQAGRNPSQ